MNKIIIWYSIHNGGDGSAYNVWFLTEEEANIDQENHNQNEGWAEDCTGHVETFEGSDIHLKAMNNKIK